MAGLERADTGSVRVAGQELTKLSEDQLAIFRGNAVGIVFQSFHLIPTMTAIENVAVPLELTGRADAFERAKRELEGVGLGERIHHYPAQLSGGMARRVALARAIALDPMMVLYDEPFAGQDPISMGVLVKLIRTLNDALGLTSVIVSHDVKETAAIADYLYLISDGQIVEHGTPHELDRSNSPWVDQFMHALPDGPMSFHYPASPYEIDLLARALA